MHQRHVEVIVQPHHPPMHAMHPDNIILVLDPVPLRDISRVEVGDVGHGELASYSGFRISAPRGGMVRGAELSRPCLAISSAMTDPPFPMFEPP